MMRRKLGQHFLKDSRALKKIVAALEITPRDIIVEIGPGHGELTKVIVDKFISLKVGKFKIIAIEKDARLASQLKNSKLGKSRKLGVITGDVLKELELITCKLKTYKLVGNVPYYITGYLFRKISELERKPKLIVLTIQKEVAERVCAAPRKSTSGLRKSVLGPGMNLLAASVQFWGKPQIIGYISKKSFRPPPKVDSAILRIIPMTHFPRPWKMGHSEKYYRFVKILFKQPRKTILNNLREGLKLPQKEVEKQLQKLNISPSLRPANLSMSDINKLVIIFRDKGV